MNGSLAIIAIVAVASNLLWYLLYTALLKKARHLFADALMQASVSKVMQHRLVDALKAEVPAERYKTVLDEVTDSEKVFTQAVNEYNALRKRQAAVYKGDNTVELDEE